MTFLATAAKKQRSEVRLTELTATEREEFAKAKDTEITNWLKTGTVQKMFRNQLSPEQILKCRWILTWKPIENSELDPRNPQKTQTGQGTDRCFRLHGPKDHWDSSWLTNSEQAVKNVNTSADCLTIMGSPILRYQSSVPAGTTTEWSCDRYWACTRTSQTHADFAKRDLPTHEKCLWAHWCPLSLVSSP